jgi:hypothetical protein
MDARRRFLTGVCVCVLALGLAAQAHAQRTMQTSLMDDQQLIYDSPAVASGTMAELAGLGVTQIKVSMVWWLVAPNPDSAQKPNFDATDPNAYPPGAWNRYDRVVDLAQQYGIKVYFEIDPQIPAWAIDTSVPTGRYRLGDAPDPTDFEQFVEAVGRRYSGSFVPTQPVQPPYNPPPIQVPGLPPVPIPSKAHAVSRASSQNPIPRVSTWGIWNEPNWYVWLDPLYRTLPGGKREYLQPPLYRGIVNAAWQGLEATGHSPATDTILIGETANAGPRTPKQFLLELYCLDARDRMLTGLAAEEVGCSYSSRSAFVSANPGLFDASGFAHHPWSFNVAPNRGVRNWYTLYNMGALEQLLSGILRSYGRRHRGGVPLYLTEFGYESNPPNPDVKNTARQQAVWLNEAEYMAWKNPYVRMLNQFELIDSGPNTAYRPNDSMYWYDSVDSGLEFSSAQPKPALTSFRIPIWLPVPRHGRAVAVWGQLRPANHSRPQSAVLQFERAGAHSFGRLRQLRTTSGEGFLFVHARIPAAGLVRIAWTDPGTGTVEYSRAASVS